MSAVNPELTLIQQYGHNYTQPSSRAAFDHYRRRLLAGGGVWSQPALHRAAARCRPSFDPLVTLFPETGVRWLLCPHSPSARNSHIPCRTLLRGASSELPQSTIGVVALLAASLADHRQARDAQIAGLLLAGCRLRFSQLQFVGYEAPDSYLMPEVPVKLNGAAA
jgi:hypothetical protein